MPKLIDIILVLVLLLILGAAVAYIVRAKKKGAKCIGCPASGTCGHKSKGASGCGCGCGGAEHEEKSECCCGGSEDKAEGECCCHTDTKE
ncbi:MAG: FeoB-associated Cys-rich membrane protein [Lachnospiraceae bacterium]|nr:FeoB-associated Cys-rich membrane protein [Lachnospiraceae bacterium]MBQ7781917.1 FeoB-associated Cys-rich membrane protein [Lachnospiraceae bacterium]